MDLPVVGGDLGRHVHGRRRGQHKVLGGLVVALLAADHEVVEELPVLEEVVGLMVLLDEVRDDVEVTLCRGEPEWDAAVGRLGGGGGAALHQQLHHVQVPRLGGAVHRRPAVLEGSD